MKLFLKFLTAALLVVFFFSAIFAGGLYWTFNFGECKDGCGEGMAFIFFLPAVVTAGVSGIAAAGLYLAGRRHSRLGSLGRK